MGNPNKSLEKLIVSYYNPNAGIYEDEAKILAVKYVIAKGPLEAMAYLDEDDVLDLMNGKKDFFKDKDSFDKYLDYALFDKKFPKNRKNYLYGLKKNSKMLERMVAAKVIDESKSMFFDLEDEDSLDEFGSKTVYEVAQTYLDEGRYAIKGEAIHNALYEVIRNNADEDLRKLLGTDAFLEVIRGASKLKQAKFNYFSDEAKYLYGINPKNRLEAHNLIKKIVTDKYSKEGFDLITEKIREVHFPDSGLSIVSFDDDEEDDEEFE